MVRVLVCGGRDFTDTKGLYKYLDNLHRTLGITTIIEGDAKGADRMAGFWARKNKITNVKFKAAWEKFGSKAGPIRNQQMLDQGIPQLVVAFPGGRGTEDMINRAKEAQVETLVLKRNHKDG